MHLTASPPGRSRRPAAGFSIRRTAILTRCHAALLARNRHALFYAVLMPLLPLALLFTGERGSPAVGAVAIVVMFQVIALIPVYSTTSSPATSGVDTETRNGIADTTIDTLPRPDA